MCFSATASFAAAAVLIPGGAYGARIAIKSAKSYWAIGLLPIVFGIQQAMEGGVWLALNNGDIEAVRRYALGFMFFSHFFWLFWIAISCCVIETRLIRKRIFLRLR